MFDKEFSLNLRSKQPLADQLRDHILRLIEAGAIQPGQQLPTVREAALQYDVNFNTVARAYRALDQMGTITTRQGRGTYVIGAQKFDYEPADKTQVLDTLLNRLLAEAEQNHISPVEVILALRRKIQNASARVNQKRRRRRSMIMHKPVYSAHLLDGIPQKEDAAKVISFAIKKRNQASRRRRKHIR